MKSLNSLPVLPLQKIVDLLDEKSCNNLLIASVGSELEIKLENMARIKTMICPYCAGRAGFDNISEHMESNGWKLTRKTQEENTKFVRLHNEFNFFRQFEHTRSGDDNYQRTYGYDGCYKIESKNVDFNKYDKIFFMGDHKTSKHWWGQDYIKTLKTIQKGDVKAKQFCKKRLENIFLGGKFDGVPVKSTMELFTREDLLIHIREFHHSDRVQEARKKNPYRWYNAVAREGQLITVPEDMYFISEFGEPRSMLDQHELEGLVLDITTARYIRKYYHEEISGRHFMNSNHYMMTEVKEVYKMIKNLLDEIRYPKIASLSSDIRYHKMIDMTNITFDLVY